MSVVANVAVNLDASKAVNALNALNSKSGDVTRNIGGAFQTLGGKLETFGQKFQSVGGVLASLGAGAALSGIVKAGLEADNLNRRITALAGASGESQKVFEIASQAASKFGMSQNEAASGVADLYGRLRPAGIALTDIKSVFFGVSNAANAMGLSGDQASGVMLQLSQALGSGKLQGDELRSVMEQLPAVGQAVAKVMGVTVGEVKQLGADGKITTEIMIKAAKELEKMAGVDPTPMRKFQAAVSDLSTTFGQQLTPVLIPIIEQMTGLLRAFGALPQPIQQATVAIVALAGAFVIIAPAITTLGTALTALASLQLGAVIAGWAGAVGPAVAAIISTLSGLLAWVGGTLIPGLLAFFSGPVGWTVLAVAAVVAMAIAFREPILKFFSWLGGAVRDGVKVVWQAGEPIRKFWVGVWDTAKRTTITFLSWIRTAWQSIGTAFTGYVVKPLTGAWNSIINTAKSALRALLLYIANQINKVGGLINNLISAYNRLPAPDIPLVPRLIIPAFAQGGVVTGPTLAMVGEGGEPEYIIPQSKMRQASMNYLSGARGDSVLGVSSSESDSVSPRINITTGPVIEMDGKQYVTMADLERAMRMTAEGVIGKLRTPSARTALGMR